MCTLWDSPETENMTKCRNKVWEMSKRCPNRLQERLLDIYQSTRSNVGKSAVSTWFKLVKGAFPRKQSTAKWRPTWPYWDQLGPSWSRTPCPTALRALLKFWTCFTCLVAAFIWQVCPTPGPLQRQIPGYPQQRSTHVPYQGPEACLIHVPVPVMSGDWPTSKHKVIFFGLWPLGHKTTDWHRAQTAKHLPSDTKLLWKWCPENYSSYLLRELALSNLQERLYPETTRKIRDFPK